MSYILYGDKGSGSGPVEMVLGEIGAPVELREVPLSSDSQLAAEYREINPMGRVPTLVLPDGTVMTESFAILLTLADRHPEAGLLPEPGSSDRARVLRWMALIAGEAYPHVTRSDYPARFLDDPAQAAPLKARALEMYREIWRLVEAQAGLTGRPDAPYFLGERFSLADPYFAVLSRWMKGTEWLAGACPKVAALAAAVKARPAIAPVWARHFGG